MQNQSGECVFRFLCLSPPWGGLSRGGRKGALPNAKIKREWRVGIEDKYAEHPDVWGIWVFDCHSHRACRALAINQVWIGEGSFPQCNLPGKGFKIHTEIFNQGHSHQKAPHLKSCIMQCSYILSSSFQHWPLFLMFLLSRWLSRRKVSGTSSS